MICLIRSAALIAFPVKTASNFLQKKILQVSLMDQILESENQNSNENDKKSKNVNVDFLGGSIDLVLKN